MSEPRASNTKMVEYECMVGGHVEKVSTALFLIQRCKSFPLLTTWRFVLPSANS